MCSITLMTNEFLLMTPKETTPCDHWKRGTEIRQL